jgi:hypothetical protein
MNITDNKALRSGCTHLQPTVEPAPQSVLPTKPAPNTANLELATCTLV